MDRLARFIYLEFRKYHDVKPLFRLLLTGLISTLCLSSFSQTTIYSAVTGAWNEGTTWIGGSIPAPRDNAIIGTGHTVSLATGSGETIHSLTIMQRVLYGHRTTTQSYGTHELVIVVKLGDNARCRKWINR